jgi:hypothetical protein
VRPPSPSSPVCPACSGSSRPTSTLASVAHRVRRRRRRRRVWVAATAGLAVVVAVLGGLAVGTAADRGTVQARPTTTAVPGADRYAMSGRQGFTVDLAVQDASWGTRFDWGCSYGGKDWAADGSVMYDLVVLRTDGRTQTVGTWTAAGEDARGLAATTDIPRADISGVQVRLHDGGLTLASVDL